MSEQDLQAVRLDTMKGVQEALAKLGYDPGDADGFDGPHTQKAVKAFQTTAGIAADGVVGPHTRSKIADALLALDERPAGDPTTPPAASETPDATPADVPTDGGAVKHD
jgi:peptidoglycan hydrolase-like protein with peptidoglycan-binding domain